MIIALVTLHGRFTISVEQDDWNWWTLSTIFSELCGSR